jgi:hypothetical protein
MNFEYGIGAKWLELLKEIALGGIGNDHEHGRNGASDL